MGDARKARGFQHLPKIINILKKNKQQFNYIIQYSKISDDLLDVKKELIKLSKKDKIFLFWKNIVIIKNLGIY